MVYYMIFGWLFVGCILFVAEFYRADNEPPPEPKTEPLDIDWEHILEEVQK